MALRHVFPNCGPMDLQLFKEPDKIVPVLKRGRLVEFRRGADLDSVCGEIVGRQRITVNAAAGAGKSTKLPLALAEKARTAVFHVVPSIHLSAQIYDYCVKSKFKGNKTFCEKWSDPIGTSGVTYTNSANMVGLLLTRKMDTGFTEFQNGVYVYLDECHESDAYTHILRRLVSQVAGVSCVIEASASHGLDHRKMPDLPANIVSEVFPSQPPSEWDPADQKKPWSASNIRDAALLYVDEEDSAERLKNLYSLAGYTVFRLHAKMPVSAFRYACEQLFSPVSGVIILIADYTFRSGFTFPVSVIVDSGLVKYYTIANGVQEVRFRYAYELEMYQAQHRGARIDGLDCKYYAPEKEPLNAICDLEGVETEAAALLFRYLGYVPPRECEVAFMCNGNVPKRFEEVVNGSVTFTLLGEDQMMPLVKSSFEEESDGANEVLAEYGIDSALPSPIKDYFNFDMGPSVPLSSAVPDAMAELLDLKTLTHDKNVLIPGRYYKIPGLPDETVTSSLFDSDWQKALVELQKKPYLVAGYTETERLEVIALLLENYNIKVAVQAGINLMTQNRDTLRKLTTRYPNHAKKWLETVLDKLRDAKASQIAILDVLTILRPAGMEFYPLAPDIEMENNVAKQYASNLVDAVQGVDDIVQGDQYLKFIESRVEGLPPPEGTSYEKLTVQNGRRDHLVKVVARPCSVQGRPMWDVIMTIQGGLMWNVDECVNVVSAYITKTGISVALLRNLKFVGPDVDSFEVLNKLRKMDDLRHRHKMRQKYVIDSGGENNSGVKLLEVSGAPKAVNTVQTVGRKTRLRE